MRKAIENLLKLPFNIFFPEIFQGNEEKGKKFFVTQDTWQLFFKKLSSLIELLISHSKIEVFLFFPCCGIFGVIQVYIKKYWNTMYVMLACIMWDTLYKMNRIDLRCRSSSYIA